jgi:putative transposase
MCILLQNGQRIRNKIKNLVRDFHHKFAKYLCQNYSYILLSEFQTKQMSKRENRRIRKKSVRAMLTWSHFRFRQRLLHKSREYPWTRIFLVDEPYTSKTCGVCGSLHHKLGGNKTFCCPSCKVVIDRDINGARNILLRFLTVDARAIAFRRYGDGAYPLSSPREDCKTFAHECSV